MTSKMGKGRVNPRVKGRVKGRINPRLMGG